MVAAVAGLTPAPSASSTAGPAGGRAAAPAGALTTVVSFRLSGGHFAAALVFLLAGSWGLLYAAGDLAAGRFLVRPVVAVTHLLTLGWLTTSIMGALYQLLPVVLGVPAASERAGYGSVALFAPGLALFVGGMLAGGTTVLLSGAVLLSAGLVVFLANVGIAVARVRKRDLTWWAVAGSLVFLLVTVVLGASLAGNMRWFWLGGSRLMAVGVHVHVALGGWVLLMMIGVARRLLPMFLLSHGASTRPGTAAAVCVAAGAGILTVFHHAPSSLVGGVSGTLLALGTVAFLVQCVLYVRHSHRPALDAGLRIALSGLVLLAVAVALGVLSIAGGFNDARLTGAYGAALVLSFSLFVIGHYYKIVPFLVWNHRFAALVARGRSVPRVADLFRARTADAAFILLAAGSTLTVPAVATGAVPLARLGALLFAAGATLATVQLFTLFLARPRT
jgi:hypothetical protein